MEEKAKLRPEVTEEPVPEVEQSEAIVPGRRTIIKNLPGRITLRVVPMIEIHKVVLHVGDQALSITPDAALTLASHMRQAAHTVLGVYGTDEKFKAGKPKHAKKNTKRMKRAIKEQIDASNSGLKIADDTAAAESES